jgi:hypothetical protein
MGLFTELETESDMPFLNKPIDIDADADGNYYVLEEGNHRIKKYDCNFKYIKSFGRWGRGPGEFLVPSAIEIDQSGNIYVGDNMHERLLVFDDDGNLKKSVSVNGHEMFFKILSNGNIYIINPTIGYADGAQELSLLHLLDSIGKRLFEIGDGIIYKQPPFSNGGNRFRFDVDQSGNVCIVFLFQNRIEKYNAEGEMIFSMKRAILDEMQINKKLDLYYALTGGLSFDDKGRIWNIERVHRPPKYSSETLKNALVVEDGRIRVDRSKLPTPQKTDQYAIDLYNQDGVFLYRYNLDHNCSNIRIIGDKLFVFDKEHSMDIYIYQITDKTSL